MSRRLLVKVAILAIALGATLLLTGDALAFGHHRGGCCGGWGYSRGGCGYSCGGCVSGCHTSWNWGCGGCYAYSPCCGSTYTAAFTPADTGSQPSAPTLAPPAPPVGGSHGQTGVGSIASPPNANMQPSLSSPSNAGSSNRLTSGVNR
jgi:hypothetical protein